MRLDYIVLPGEDPQRIMEWYRSHLDLTVAWESDDFVLLTGESGARLGIHRGSPLPEPESVRLHFEVDDVDETFDRLRANGLEFMDHPTDTDWGYRSVTCHDPIGHTVELFTSDGHR